MHEVSLMAQTLAIALEQAQHQGATQIQRLRMRIGAQAGVVPEALQFAFEVGIQDTIAAGASLDIETVPVSCFCEPCQRDFQPDDWFYQCPQCQTLSDRVLAGREIELVSLEVL
ncbi:hydrogenase maturation nickel metallochaperone HypA [Prochlorothrix hollandica]|uniref:Hydrogenase maturation factor HypA n=1 Tax=Prochlorothrix hollandica PCC 9006 = CALU 1027 TaxID=317619 RepID=A0A0M2PZ47_PROHO|nr:hydrogenase maturation nickel metallochaperone HypA [Prochlorothrix hollandica]KKI99968.1 hydrogenase nickel incorporation protein HypA [Prochlorothrix hollandica PCC 9006 = CALU 1027]